ARALLADPAETLHFVEGLPHADEARAAAGRVEDRVRQSTEVFEQLVAHDLFALDAVRLLERGEVEAAAGGDVLLHALGGVGDHTGDELDLRAVAAAFVDDRLRRVARHRHEYGQPGARAVRGERRAGVARGG